MKFFRVFEVTFDYVPRVAVGGNFHDIEVGNIVLEKEAKISYWQRLRHGRSTEVICVQIYDPAVGFGRVVPLHQRLGHVGAK